jgi:hypothetical protein
MQQEDVSVTVRSQGASFRSGQVIRRLDAASVEADGEYRLAWAHTLGSGPYYNALGHFAEMWRDQRFQRQIAGAIRWAGKKL